MSVKNCNLNDAKCNKLNLAEQARKFADAHKPIEYTVHKASDILLPIEILPPDELVIRLCRVSEREQAHRGNLQDQANNMDVFLIKNGNPVYDTVSYTGSGQKIKDLRKAVRLAERVGASLVGESTDRVMRPQEFNTDTNLDEVQHPEDLEFLKEIIGPVKVYTLLHPDTPPSEVRSYQKRRGIRMKKEKSKSVKGRDAFRHKWITTVLQLKEQGMSLRQIAEHINQKTRNKSISHESIRLWLRNTQEKG